MTADSSATLTRRRRSDPAAQSPQTRRPGRHPARTRRPGPPPQTQPHRLPGDTARRRVSRRESRSAALRGAKASLDPAMRLDTWTAPENLRYDRTLLADLAALRFLDEHQSAIILGPVGVGKTHLATALGHNAIRRRHTVLFARADKLFTRLRAARLDNTVDAETRRLTTIDVLIIDDFALRPSTPPKPATSTRSSSNATAPRPRS